MYKLFLSGFIQVSCVALNTVFITKFLPIHVFVTGFLISLVWSFNVKKIAFGEWKDRVAYAGGAATGGLVGMYLGKIITLI